MSMRLDFESLFRQALKDWPEALDLRVLEYTTPDLSRYTVKGLGNLSDEIEESYIGTDVEIIFRDLHISIYTVVREAAKYVLEINMSTIRAEAVRLVFERRIKYAVSATNLNWSQADYDLVESYFAHNSLSAEDNTN